VEEMGYGGGRRGVFGGEGGGGIGESVGVGGWDTQEEGRLV